MILFYSLLKIFKNFLLNAQFLLFLKYFLLYFNKLVKYLKLIIMTQKKKFLLLCKNLLIHLLSLQAIFNHLLRRWNCYFQWNLFNYLLLKLIWLLYYLINAQSCRKLMTNVLGHLILVLVMINFFLFKFL